MVFARTAASRLLSLAAVAAATTAGTTAWGATTYALDTLGISDVAASVNPFGSAAAGISPDGKIAGPLVGSDGHNKPFLYTPGTATAPATLTQLPTLGGAFAQGTGVNDAGQLSGYSSVPGTTGAIHAARWTNGQPADLGTLSGGTNSYGVAINAGGQVAGYGDVASGSSHAFRATGSQLTDLGTLGTGTDSLANGINAAGVVVGVADAPGNSGFTGAFDGVYWDASNAIHQIPTLGGSQTDAGAINGLGQITGYSGLAAHGAYADSEVADAFIYDTTTGQMKDLGNLGGTYLFAFAEGINNLGEVVGAAYTTDFSDERAFVYADGRVQNLNDLVNAPGWTLQYAFGVNDAGQIVGQGLNPAGDEQAFLLTPTGTAVPEPASASLAAVAAVGLLGRRGRLGGLVRR